MILFMNACMLIKEKKRKERRGGRYKERKGEEKECRSRMEKRPDGDGGSILPSKI